ncbi:MAG: hypothetical protein WD941_05060 [Opitutus sp.]
MICLITPGHVASTPRLVKNADALAEAGYRVHVVAGRYFEPADALDEGILAAAPWSYSIVDYRSGAGVWLRKFRRQLARRLIRRLTAPGVLTAALAHHGETQRLARVAAAQPAQLFLGHCLAGLPAAAFAAALRGAPCGFDAEDFHDAETGDREASSDRIARRILHAKLLPGCTLFTAASPLIARHYAAAYGREPLTLLNVFPLAHAPVEPLAPRPISTDRPAVLYWFSQTIGPGRGLEAVIRIVGRMHTPVVLHLRGFVSEDYRRKLQQVASRERHDPRLTFLPPGQPEEMARLAASADLGLSTEEKIPPNRDLCLTNKIFVYLLAGLPQLLSATSAQTALASELGESALLCDLDQPDAPAAQLDAFLSSPARIASARNRAWRLARDRFCWDIEKSVLLDAVARLHLAAE